MKNGLLATTKDETRNTYWPPVMPYVMPYKVKITRLSDGEIAILETSVPKNWWNGEMWGCDCNLSYRFQMVKGLPIELAPHGNDLYNWEILE